MFTPLCWTSHPHEWQPLFRQWAKDHSDMATLRQWTQYGGAEVLALTLSAAPNPKECPFRLLVTVPHGHEPAPTAAIVDIASQLLTRLHLDDTPSLIPKDMVLRRSLVTLVPDTNPQGRARSPERCWDGSAYDNDAFLKVAFGIAEDGERFGRYPEWRPSEHHPQQIGVVYEQIEDDLYVEPNTSKRSTHSRVVDELFAEYEYTHMLDMHQHEGDEAALLPAEYDDLPSAEQTAIWDWAHRLIDAWKHVGLHPRPTPAIPYRGQPRQQFFKDFWAGRCPGMKRLVSEARNNRHSKTEEPTRMDQQFRGAHAALEATLRMALMRGAS